MMEADQNLVNAELHAICASLMNKFTDIKQEIKATTAEELRDLTRVLFHGVKLENLHDNFKLNIFHFFKYVLTFSDVRAQQNGINYKSKLLISLVLRLMCLSYNESLISSVDGKEKRLLYFLCNLLKRNISLDTSITKNIVFQSITGIDAASSSSKVGLLYLPSTLSHDQQPWTVSEAGEISKKLGQWLLLHCNQSTSSSRKKSIFQSKALSPVS